MFYAPCVEPVRNRVNGTVTPSLPAAVLLSVGAEGWPMLEPAYTDLLRSHQVGRIVTLAIHE